MHICKIETEKNEFLLINFSVPAANLFRATWNSLISDTSPQGSDVEKIVGEAITSKTGNDSSEKPISNMIPSSESLEILG